MESKKSINEIITFLKEKWCRPRSVLHQGKKCPFDLLCTFSEDFVSSEEIAIHGLFPSDDLLEFWKICNKARLFEDKLYGQWGLELLSPEEVSRETSDLKNERPDDYVNGDLIIGKFIGDSDLLLMRCDPATEDFGLLLIVSPIDKRSEWYHLLTTLADFLLKYSMGQGKKYWEQ